MQDAGIKAEMHMGRVSDWNEQKGLGWQTLDLKKKVVSILAAGKATALWLLQEGTIVPIPAH